MQKVSVASLETDFSASLAAKTCAEIADCIWGRQQAVIGNGDESLKFYFEYYARQTNFPHVNGLRYRRQATASLRPLRTHRELLAFIAVLKAHPQSTRKSLKGLVSTDDTLSSVDVDSALDLSVKIMLMISCASAKNVITTGNIFRPQWRDSETLEELVERALPRHDIEPTLKPEPIRAQDLKFANVSSFGKIKIEWTDNLPDHLFLQITDRWKRLKVFKHAAILEVSLQSAATDEQQTTLVNSLSR